MSETELTNGRYIPKRGECVAWRTVGGAKYEGIVQAVDSNVLYVRCTDGVVRCAEW